MRRSVERLTAIASSRASFLAQMRVVEPRILAPRQLDHALAQLLRRPVRRRPALVAMQHPTRVGTVEDLLKPLHLSRAAPQRFGRLPYTHSPGDRVFDHHQPLYLLSTQVHLQVSGVTSSLNNYIAKGRP